VALLGEIVSGRWSPALDLAAADGLADALGRQAGGRVTLIAPGGRVLGDSEVDTAKIPTIGNHADRPEIIQALAQGRGWSLRHSATLGTGLLYVAHRLDEAGGPKMVVRLSLPLTEVEAVLDKINRLILYSTLFGVLLSIGAAYLVARRMSRPVKELTRTATRIGDGDLSQRLRRYPSHEIGDLGRAFDRMADHLQSQIEAATEARDRLETTLRSMAEGVLVLGPDGRAVAANRSLSKMLDLSVEPLGLTVSEMVRHADLQEAVAGVLSGQGHCSLEMRTLGARPRVLEVHIAPLAGEDDRAGAVAVFRDVTESKRLEDMRRDFVANVSHELRTPLTAIQGSVETLLDGVLDSGQRARDFVEMIARQAKQLGRLVEDLMDLARIESGADRPQLREIKAADVADSVLNTVASLAAGKEVTLAREIPPEPVTVKADPDQLKQALVNLLNNAIKYSGAGSRVALAVEGRASEVMFSVSDNGPGIAPEHKDRIFERFYRVDKNRSRELGGTGLGLAIVKHIVQGHSGRLELESKLGQGSTFRIFLPA